MPAGHSGRPRASSREVLAEAACELFLERSFDATTVADITSRAGVSRSSFFNYFASKSDILWAALDERLDDAARALAQTDDPVRAVLAGILVDFTPDSLALAIANADVMGIGDELERERALRQARLARAVADRMRAGTSRLRAEVAGAAAAGAVLAAVWQWADAGAGRVSLNALVEEALDEALGPA